MKYTAKQIIQLYKSYNKCWEYYLNIHRKITKFEKKIKNTNTREYLIHGVLRRFNIIWRCIENIYKKLPPEEEKVQDISISTDITINLHAFLINIYGIIDNLGLFVAYENNIFSVSVLDVKQRRETNFFNPKFQEKLSEKLQLYFTRKEIINWYNEYAKNYRNALAHRIAPYVPTAELSDRDIEERNIIEKEIEKFKFNGSNYDELHDNLNKFWSIGSTGNCFTHSFSEKSGIVPIHLQILNDFITIKEMILIVLRN